MRHRTPRRYVFGRNSGKNLYYHQWFRSMALTMKEGQTLGIPLNKGIAIFEFKGIKKPRKPKIIIEGM